MSQPRAYLLLSVSLLLALGMLWGQGVFSIPVGANTPPVANAGPDQTVAVGTTVHLDGSQSADVDGDALRFH